MNPKAMMVAVGCFIYTVSPIDIMPEALLGPFGLGDDVIAIIVGIRQAFQAFSKAVPQEVENRRNRLTQG